MKKVGIVTRPRILLSRCFLKPVRYNGKAIDNQFVNRLLEFADFLDFCPELDIGLGVPRDPLIIVRKNKLKRLIQATTGIDFTEKILEYSKRVIDSLCNVDGALLKAKSPSCGVLSARIYEDGKYVGKTNGLFVEELKKAFHYMPIEDERRLEDPALRHHFLTRIFAFSELRELKANPALKLDQFHMQYKFLLMTYSQKAVKEMEDILSKKNMRFEEKIKDYCDRFYKAFCRKPSIKRHLKTIQKIFELFSDRLTSKERKELLHLVNRYSQGRLQLTFITEKFKKLAQKFETKLLLSQKYIEPYPEELRDL